MYHILFVSLSWEQRKVGDHCDMFNGDRSSKYPNAQDMVSDGIPFINAGDLEDGHVNLATCNKITREKYDDLGGAKLQLGDIVYCLRGTLGKNAYIDNFTEGTVASSLVALRPKNIDGRYLFHILNSDIEYKQRIVHDEGAAQPNLSAKSVSEFIMPVPDIEEQKKVSEFLDELNNLITLHQRDKYISLCRKLYIHYFYPCSWEQRKFSDVVDIGSGMDYKHLGEGDIPVYGTGGYMLSVDAALSEDKDAIGIGRKGTIDKPYILRAPFWTVDTLFYCIPKDGYDLDFTSCLFQNVDWKKKDESTGVPSLSKVIINNVETAAPSYEEQRKIGDYFKGIDNLITLHQRKGDCY